MTASTRSKELAAGTMEPNRLCGLSPEIIALILNYVQDSSERSLASVSLTCKYMFDVALEHVANRHKTIDVDDFAPEEDDFEEVADKIYDWADDKDICSNLRILTVAGNSEELIQRTEEAGLITRDYFDNAITRLLRSAGNVQLLVWRAIGYPRPQVLKALRERHPDAKLRVLDFEYGASGLPSPVLQALAESPALTQLRCKIDMGKPDFSYGAACESAFRYVVAKAPNLARATIQNYLTGHTTRHSSSSGGSFNGGGNPGPSGSVRDLTLDGYDMSLSTLDYWGKYVDLSKLQNIRFFRGRIQDSYFVNAPRLLPGLKHFSMNLRNNHGVENATILEYLKACAPLQTLSLWSWTGNIQLDPIIDRHGATLTTLGLHDREMRYGAQDRTILTKKQLKSVLTRCPNLKSLTLDLKRRSEMLLTDGTDGNTGNFELIRDSKIEKLEIYFDAGIAFPYQEEMIEAQFERVRDHHIAPGSDQDDSDNGVDGTSDDDHGGDSTGGDEAEGDGADSDVKDVTRADNVARPSTPDALEAYVKFIWKTVFGAKTTGERALTVKVGEWETYHNFASNEHSYGRAKDTVWKFEVTEMESDGKRGEPKVEAESFRGYGL